MTRLEKEKQIREIGERSRKAKVTIFSNFCGLKVREMEELRRQFRPLNVEYKVYKNTLIQRALEGQYKIDEFLSEPTALTFGYEEITGTAKVLISFAKDKPALKIKGGLIEGRVMDAESVTAVAELPPREFLLALLVGGIKTPLNRFMSVLNGPIVKLIMVLKAIEDNKKQQKA